MPMGVADTFIVEPGAGLIIWTIYAPLALCALTVTLLKGRIGWFFLGVITGGLLWFVGAFLAPIDPSPWTWLHRRRAESRG